MISGKDPVPVPKITPWKLYFLQQGGIQDLFHER